MSNLFNEFMIALGGTTTEKVAEVTPIADTALQSTTSVYTGFLTALAGTLALASPAELSVGELIAKYAIKSFVQVDSHTRHYFNTVGELINVDKHDKAVTGITIGVTHYC